MASNAEQLGLIALRIRDLRDIAGLTTQQVADQTGISLEEYEAYETGTRDFSFSHLFNIAEALGVDISDLLTGESPKLHGYILTRAGQGLKFNRREQYVYHHLAYNFRDKLAEPFIVTVSQDAPGAEKQAHSHEGQEFDYVLEGKLRINLGGNDLYLQAGDSIYYNSALPHVMYALEGDCRFIAVVIKEGAKA
ncbi:MAG TPA: cupin domain-containing protein [Candidatus Limiplasma sp.]|nr:cupin domain-containing protein [Candidatus Limiplasma sp.]HPS81805.1 cupin domain-containing protein [Candidatus Limiplasma sp.]